MARVCFTLKNLVNYDHEQNIALYLLYSYYYYTWLSHPSCGGACFGKLETSNFFRTLCNNFITKVGVIYKVVILCGVSRCSSYSKNYENSIYKFFKKLPQVFRDNWVRGYRRLFILSLVRQCCTVSKNQESRGVIDVFSFL